MNDNEELANNEPANEELAGYAGWMSMAGGALGLVSVVLVIGGELLQGADRFMGSGAAQLAGWAGFVSAALLAVGLIGLGARYASVLSRGGQVALLLLGGATAVAVGAASTLALVVPTLAESAPGLVEEPPAAVPPTFVLSGLLMGICAIVVAVGLRRAGAAPRFATRLLIVAAVVTMVPLPSRYFLLAAAVGLLALVPARAASPVALGEGALVGPGGRRTRVGA